MFAALWQMLRLCYNDKKQALRGSKE